MPEINLKPCPFCGGEARLCRTSSGYIVSPATIMDHWQVKCSNMCCVSQVYKDEIYHDERAGIVIAHNGAEEAAEAWNRRADNA